MTCSDTGRVLTGWLAGRLKIAVASIIGGRQGRRVSVSSLRPPFIVLQRQEKERESSYEQCTLKTEGGRKRCYRGRGDSLGALAASLGHFVCSAQRLNDLSLLSDVVSLLGLSIPRFTHSPEAPRPRMVVLDTFAFVYCRSKRQRMNA